MGRTLYLDNTHREWVGPCTPRDTPDEPPYTGDDVVAFWALQTNSNIPAANLVVTRYDTRYLVEMDGADITAAFDGLPDRTTLYRVVAAASGVSTARTKAAPATRRRLFCAHGLTGSADVG